MALGEQYNNNKKFVEPVVHSRYAFSNPNSKVDQTRIGFDFWAGLLKVTVSPKKGENSEGFSTWDYENNISIYLPHTKAEMFKEELIKFLNNKNEYNNSGVGAGAGLISISNGKEYGIDCPVITIRNINEQGAVQASFAYQINQQYYFAIKNFNEKEPSKYEKEYYDNLEIEQIIKLLDSYVKATSGAIAYSVIENNRFNNSRINTKLDLTCEKLGIEFKKGSNKSSNSFFKGNNNNKSNAIGGDNSKGYNSKTLEDIDTMMDS